MSRRRAALVLALVALLLAASTTTTQGLTARSHPGAASSDTTRSNPAGLSPDVGRTSQRGLISFVGVDGVTYEASPPVVYGSSGRRIFFGEDFDAACWYGDHLDDGLRQLRKLARVIEKSGRHVVWTVAPNKSAVATDDLPVQIPHGRCAKRGIAQQNRILDNFTDPRFISLRSELERQSARGANVYWHLDTHWSTVAASQFAEGVADKLNPRIAALQRYRTKKGSIPVDLGTIGLIDQKVESGKVRVSRSPVRVRPAGGETEIDIDTLINPDISWRTGPAARTWRGNTLLLGDSFMYRSLSVMMPMFRHGRFLWLNNIDDAEVLAAIAKSDTVVFELVQRYVGASRHVQTEFRRAVRDALAVYDGRHRK